MSVFKLTGVQTGTSTTATPGGRSEQLPPTKRTFIKFPTSSSSGLSQSNNANITSRLLPTQKDSEKYKTRQGITVTKNNNGSVTYKLPKQYWGDDGLLLGVQTTEYTVKDGKISNLKVTYYYSPDNTNYKNYADDVKIESPGYTYTWKNGEATFPDKEFDIHTGKFRNIETKAQIPLSKITGCTVDMLQKGKFAEIMANNPVGWGHVWPEKE